MYCAIIMSCIYSLLSSFMARISATKALISEFNCSSPFPCQGRKCIGSFKTISPLRPEMMSVSAVGLALLRCSIACLIWLTVFFLPSLRKAMLPWPSLNRLYLNSSKRSGCWLIDVFFQHSMTLSLFIGIYMSFTNAT